MKTILWCCVGIDFKNGPYYDWTSLSYKRTDSIRKLAQTLKGWRYYKSKGWSCQRVEVQIKQQDKQIWTEL